ncbi:MAG TPA: hypothetical protein VE641_14550, partial [Chthoniobacterales bacterium]|nr:hypothetical protein [Chthoniobacterales bacterium]
MPGHIVRIELGERPFHALIRYLIRFSPTPICYLLFAVLALHLRLVTHEKQSNRGHHAREQHD